MTTFITDTSMAPDEIAVEVEEAGLDSLFLPEHTHIPSSRATPAPMGEPLPEHYRRLLDPFVALMAAGAATTRIRLGPGICLVAEHDPIALAKTVATLDHLTSGRVTFGVGYGWNREEMADHGVAFEDRRAVTRESVLLMRRLWEDDEASFEGEHLSLSPSWAWPKPAQAHVPVWLGAGAGPSSIAHLVELADGWIPIGGSGLKEALPRLRAALEDAGRDPATFDVVPFGSQPSVGKFEYFADLGITEVVISPATADRDDVMPMLEEAVKVIEQVRG